MSERQKAGSEIPRTTTTGDDARDFRHAGDGALDRASDSLHHTEDDLLFANTQGIVAAWKARWRRRRDRYGRRP
jgi:hypothetical protein